MIYDYRRDIIEILKRTKPDNKNLTITGYAIRAIINIYLSMEKELENAEPNKFKTEPIPKKKKPTTLPISQPTEIKPITQPTSQSSAPQPISQHFVNLNKLVNIKGLSHRQQNILKLILNPNNHKEYFNIPVFTPAISKRLKAWRTSNNHHFSEMNKKVPHYQGLEYSTKDENETLLNTANKMKRIQKLQELVIKFEPSFNLVYILFGIHVPHPNFKSYLTSSLKEDTKQVQPTQATTPLPSTPTKQSTAPVSSQPIIHEIGPESTPYELYQHFITSKLPINVYLVQRQLNGANLINNQGQVTCELNEKNLNGLSLQTGDTVFAKVHSRHSVQDLDIFHRAKHPGNFIKTFKDGQVSEDLNDHYIVHNNTHGEPLSKYNPQLTTYRINDKMASDSGIKLGDNVELAWFYNDPTHPLIRNIKHHEQTKTASSTKN